MKIVLILGVILLLATLIFSLQNAAVVDVKFLMWKFSTSLGLVIVASLAAGFIAGGAVVGALRLKRGVKGFAASQ